MYEVISDPFRHSNIQDNNTLENIHIANIMQKARAYSTINISLRFSDMSRSTQIAKSV